MPCTPAIVTLTMVNGSACIPPTYFNFPQTTPQSDDCGNEVGCSWITYTFPNFESIEVGLSQPVSVFPLPESTQGAKDAIIIKVEGNSQQIRMTWTIKDEAVYDMCGARLPCCETDVASGDIVNACGQVNVSTQFEQLEFWTTTFENRTIDQTFQFKICTGVPAEAYTRTVLLRDFKASISGASPLTWNASVEMIVGSDVNTIDEVT